MQDRPLIILQVEDTPEDAQLTAHAMQTGRIPYTLHVVTDGGQAVEFLKRSGHLRRLRGPT
jgi:CheY-like chemotaxis protein